jgi:hypothetical protein
VNFEEIQGIAKQPWRFKGEKNLKLAKKETIVIFFLFIFEVFVDLYLCYFYFYNNISFCTFFFFTFCFKFVLLRRKEMNINGGSVCLDDVVFGIWFSYFGLQAHSFQP